MPGEFPEPTTQTPEVAPGEFPEPTTQTPEVAPTQSSAPKRREGPEPVRVARRSSQRLVQKQTRAHAPEAPANPPEVGCIPSLLSSALLILVAAARSLEPWSESWQGSQEFGCEGGGR